MSGRRFLLIRRGGLGDLLVALPAMAWLRTEFPSWEFSLAGDPRWLPLVAPRESGGIFRQVLDATTGLMSRVPEDLAANRAILGDADLILAATADPPATWQAAAANLGLPWRENLDGTASQRGIIHIHPRPQTRPAALHFLQCVGWKNSGPIPRYRWQPGQAEALEVERWLAAQGRAKGRPAVAIHPGSGGRTKTREPEYWFEVADRIKARAVWWILGEAEEPGGWADRVAARAQRLGQGVARGWSLRQVAAALSCSDAFLGHDSGISHLAAACGAKCGLLFGPTDPAIWAPTGAPVSLWPLHNTPPEALAQWASG